MRDSMVSGLKASNGKKSTKISKLQEDLGHLEHELREQDEKIKYLSEEVEVERRESADAYERARLVCQNTETLQDQLKEEQIAHERLRQDATRAALEAERQHEEVEVERRESADAYERARLVCQNIETLQDQLKEEQIAHERLRQAATRAALETARQRESSLAEIQTLKGRLAHLESEAHRFKIIEDYHNGTLGKVEVALACKASFDYLEMQLPAELKTDPERFHYPPRVANCLGALQEIERKGGGLVLSAGSDDEDKESAQGTCEGSAHDSWVSRLEERGSEEVESGLQSIPLPTSTAVAPSRSTSASGPSVTSPKPTQSFRVTPSISPAPFPSPTP